MVRARDVLGPTGPVAARLPGYEERPEQLALAEAVERAIAERRHLLAEAGTGVGKSFAYLLPAVLHANRRAAEGPVVVSTRTIALQQQLERKDLPFLHAVLPFEWSSVTAVGRNNYVCLRRMHNAHRERATLFGDPEREAQLQRVLDWSLNTSSGTRMELDPPVDADVWEEVQAEHGNCLHRACPHFEPCPYQRARRRMESARILVVNHALYMADVALRLAGASYLPDHALVIFDEAHHLERIATESLGLRLTRGSVLWHLRRLHPRRAGRGLLQEHGTARARLLVDELRETAEAFFADLEARIGRGGADTLALEDRHLDDPLSGRLDELAGLVHSCADAVTRLDLRMEMQARARGLLALRVAVDSLCAAGDASTVRWLERGRRGAELRSAPLSVSDALREQVFGGGRVAVLTSATLAAGDGAGCGWLRRRLGIDAADTLRLGSPFDYRAAVRVVVEGALPDPGRDAPGFLAAVKSRVAHHVLEHGGRALVLCTSWSFVREIATFLRPRLEEAGIRLLVQGEAPLGRLLEEKTRDETSVLVGTDSFWEGIDVPGPALGLLVVTRLPFQQPGHPLTRARMRAVEQRGGNAFADYSLPEAVLKFRQGFGRLVRSSSDRGTVVILDPRARTRGYGRTFLDALPAGALEEADAGPRG